MDFGDLDERLDRDLRQLPPPRAPRTLLPRVLAATVNRGTAARATGWFTWPLAWRMASVAALITLAAGAWMFFTAPPQAVSNAAASAGEVATVARALWDVLLQPVATYLFVLGVSLALACALAWAALEVALGGAAHR
jgi:hypothetical protein